MKAPYHQDNYRTIYHGDCRAMAELPDESVHCVVTSPPYWGLRKYSGEQELVWGGDKDCQHEWGNRIISKANDSNRSTLEWTTGGSPASKILGQKVSQGQFCSLCGAWRGALGLEPTPELYIQHTIEILREIRRVLRKDGVVFWNIGDSYASGKGTCFNPGGGKGSFSTHGDRKDSGIYPLDRGNVSMLKAAGLKPKDLCLIPFHLGIAARDDGWWVRSDIIWNKPNPMPESMNGWRWERHRVLQWPDGTLYKRERGEPRPKEVDWAGCLGCPKYSSNDGLVLRKGSWRPTDSHEYILMLTKSDEYYCDAEAVREPQTIGTIERFGKNPVISHKKKWVGMDGESNTAIQEHIENRDGAMMGILPGGRNLRSVWTFPTQPYPGAHFATFPERLPQLCIKAATPEVGVCAKCGAPWVRVVEKKPATMNIRVRDAKRVVATAEEGYKASDEEIGLYGKEEMGYSKTLGWKSSCECGTDDKVPALALDPFMGSGTTLLVATNLGRRAVGYEISEDYCRLAVERNKQIGLV